MQCSHCGANLPDNAQYCMQCGTAVPSPGATTTEPPRKLDFTQPALAGGMALGLLSSIPIINTGNCLCCMWLIGGGGLAAYLLMQQRPTGITYGDGAFVGVLSGVFGSVVATIVTTLLKFITAPFFQNQKDTLDQIFKDVPGFEGPARDLVYRMVSPEISPLTVIVTFLSNVVLYSLFAMIGGILLVAIMEKRKARR
jgi:hypothetical protein